MKALFCDPKLLILPFMKAEEARVIHFKQRRPFHAEPLLSGMSYKNKTCSLPSKKSQVSVHNILYRGKRNKKKLGSPLSTKQSRVP